MAHKTEKEEALNWSSFERSLEERTEKLNRAARNRMLAFYHAVRASIGIAVPPAFSNSGTHEDTYLLLKDLSRAYLQCTKKIGGSHFTSIGVNENQLPEQVINFGRIEKDIEPLEENHPVVVFYNQLVPLIRNNQISDYAADFNGASCVVRWDDLYEQGVFPPLAVFLHYTEYRHLPDTETELEGDEHEQMKQELAEAEKEIEWCSEQFEFLTRQISFAAHPAKTDEIRVYEKVDSRHYEVKRIAQASMHKAYATL